MVQERSSSSAVDPNSGKPPFPPSAAISGNANSAAASVDKVDVEEEKSNSCPPGTPKSSGIRKGGWASSSYGEGVLSGYKYTIISTLASVSIS